MKNEEKKYSFKGSQEKSVKFMKNQEILLKLEESQEKVRKLYQSNLFCDAQLWRYIDVKRSLAKFKT